MRVRPYQPQDAGRMSVIFRRAVEAIGPAHYSPAQFAAWAARTPDAAAIHARAMDGRTMLVVADDTDQAVAFGDLEAGGHIDLLYCVPEAARSGVVGVLYDTLETIARERGMRRLHSEASEAAMRFFARKGFTTLHRRDLEIGGVAIHNYAVEKLIR